MADKWACQGFKKDSGCDFVQPFVASSHVFFFSTRNVLAWGCVWIPLEHCEAAEGRGRLQGMSICTHVETMKWLHTFNMGQGSGCIQAVALQPLILPFLGFKYKYSFIH